jgi:hypothetical protein
MSNAKVLIVQDGILSNFFYIATVKKEKHAEENCRIWRVTLGFTSVG